MLLTASGLLAPFVDGIDRWTSVMILDTKSAMARENN
jgi:hypothetical protein